MAIKDDITKVVESADYMNRLVDSLKFLKENYVLVGIPQAETDRPAGSPVTNAELLYIHTNGSPVNNIPARPVIEPAIRDDKDRIDRMLENIAKLAFQRKWDEAGKAVKLLGQRGQNIARGWFTNPANGWPPNSPAVQRRKAKKKATEPRPLIDTGELRKSITYVVVRKGRRET